MTFSYLPRSKYTNFFVQLMGESRRLVRVQLNERDIDKNVFIKHFDGDF